MNRAISRRAFLLMAVIVLQALTCRLILFAEVVESLPASFTIQTVIETHSNPEVSYEALLQLRKWWDPSHTWSGDSARLTLTTTADGCFCETLPGGGFVKHAVVIHADPGKTLRMSGAFGPLQEHPLTGILTFSLEPIASGTRITMIYRVGGTISGGLEKWPQIVDRVLTGQLERFGRFLNTGNPELIAGP